jgi:hypothetical protein
VGGKPVHVAFDGGRLTSDALVLVLAEIERRLDWPLTTGGRSAAAPCPGGISM